jgi:hypothetical protein
VERDRCDACGASQVVGGYRVLRVLKRTPSGRVYLCEGPYKQKLSVKEVVFALAPDAGELEAVEREAELWAQLKHPGIPRFVRCFREGEGAALRLCAAYEYVPGESLADRLAHHRFTEYEVRPIAEQLLEILHYLHGLSPQVLHLGITADSVILGEDGRVHLLGFSLAKDRAREDGRRMALPLPAGNAPEHLRGRPSQASDLYLLGATLLHVLSRVSPEEWQARGGLDRAEREINVSEPFRAFLRRLVAREERDRPANAAAALEALRAHAPRPRRRRVARWIAAALAVAGLAAGGRGLLFPEPATYVASPSATAPLQGGLWSSELERASVGGKYATLLRRVHAPEDRSYYGEFRDWGHSTTTAYAGQTSLPPAYWVYVWPNWYLWRDVGVPRRQMRAWGPEQATGPPDTGRAGDIATAWASRTPDAQPEWLTLTYDPPVRAGAVHVVETFNPGALRQVSGVTADGRELLLWEGTDPTPAGRGMGTSVVPLSEPVTLRRVTLHLDSPGVPGWNEIDAVGLEDVQGQLHWATSAAASTTYAER